MPSQRNKISARSEVGFSLLELLVVMAVLSVVSVMAVQSLGIAVTQRQFLEKVDADARSLSWVLTLLRRDLQAALPIPYEPAYGPKEAAFYVPIAGEGFKITTGGNPQPPDDSRAGFARVSWKFDRTRNALIRQVIPLQGLPGATASNLDNVVMLDVTSLSIEFIGAAVPDGDLEQLPLGFVLTLESLRYGTLVVRVVL